MTGPAEPGVPVIRDLLASFIRTAVPVVVGSVIAWLLTRGFDLTAYTNAINAWLVPACIAGYYALVRLAEARWPALGWLLGYAARPKYVDETGRPVAPPPVEPAHLSAAAERKVSGYPGGNVTSGQRWTPPPQE